MSTAFTVADFRAELDSLDDATKIEFSGHLQFYRFKRWSDDTVILEFNEPLGSRSDTFKRRNPHVKAVFIDTESMDTSDADEAGVILGVLNIDVT